MKYSITISDLSPEDAQELVTKLSDGEDVEIKYDPPKSFEETHGRKKNMLPTAMVVTPPVEAEAATPEPETAAPVEGVELDSTGLPWDERIHGATRKKTAKGVWNRKRGLQDFQFDEIVAKLRNSQESEVEAVPTQSPTVSMQEVGKIATPTPVAAVPAPVAVPPVAAVPARDFQGLMQQISKLFASQEIQLNYPDSIVTRINGALSSNITTITDVANDPNMVNFAWQCLDIDGKAA